MSDEAKVLPAVSMNQELTNAIYAAVDPAAIRAAIISEAEKQNAEVIATQTAAEKAAAEREAAEGATETDKRFSRTEVIGGKEFTFEAASELELERAVNNAFKVAYALQEPVAETVQTEPVVDAAEAERVAAAQATERADLELKFKRGEITTADYLERSGAVDDYLAKKGVPIDAIKTTIEDTDNKNFEKSWADATEEFLRSAAGADWPGGENNKTMTGMKLAAMDLIDAKDKVAALAMAYADMKRTGMLFMPDKTSATVTPAPQPESIAPASHQAPAAPAVRTTPAAPVRTTPTSSSLFGASSGVSSSPAPAANSPTKNDVKFDIPADATPAQIMEHWKQQQLASGQNVDAAFISSFQARR
jgi:hypothetical protein